MMAQRLNKRKLLQFQCLMTLYAKEVLSVGKVHFFLNAHRAKQFDERMAMRETFV